MTRSERSHLDFEAGGGIGIAATRAEERRLACCGVQECADTIFEHNESVFSGGVLLSLPALLSQGLDIMLKNFKSFTRGFYGLHHILILQCFMALCRIKSVEQLKKVPVGEMGKLLGLDRIPQVEYLRVKIRQVTSQCLCDGLHDSLFQLWTGQMSDTFFYVDGHVRVYSGELANLPKHFVSREKLCLSATTEFYVNTFSGMPLMVVNGELNQKLKVAIERAIPKIKKMARPASDPSLPVFTLVFDREAYEPGWFKQLWDDHRIAVISYRKNVKDKWDENLFKQTDVQLYGNNVPMRLCELGSLVQGHWFREIRKLSASGHQTSVVTTHPVLGEGYVAARMFARWNQENFFKYMIGNFDFDRMVEYGTEELPDGGILVANPEYKQLTHQLKKAREKRSRLESSLFKKISGEKGYEELHDKRKMTGNELVFQQIEEYNCQIDGLLKRRKSVPARIKLRDMPEEKRFNKLKEESKKLKNAVLMLVYRAETTLYETIDEFYLNNKKDGRQLLKEIFSSDADLIPDYKNNKLTVRIHSLSTPRANRVIQKLCEIMNQTKTIYPYTNLTLHYETLAKTHAP